MGLCGGSKHQKRAARAEAAKAKTNAGDGQPCPLGKCHLRVTVARADTGEGVENVTVAVTGPSPNTRQSVKDSGLADFGVVDPGQYKISLALGAADAKKFAAAAEVQLNIAKGDTKAKRVELAPFVKLRVLLIDQKGKGLAAADWDLSKPAKTGKTAADGLIEVDVPWDSDDDRKLKVKLPQPPAAPAAPAAAPAAAAAVPAPYPPAVVAADFTDDAPPVFAPESDVDWSVSLADLADGDDDDGVKARLNNLGFIVDSKDNVKRAVQAYQKQYLNQDNGSGVLKDILADIKTRHDTSP